MRPTPTRCRSTSTTSTVDVTDHPLADIELSRRLERAEGRGCAAFAMARKMVDPASTSEWIDVAGAHVVFDGVDSPVTQTFGLGIHEPADARALETIEAFYAERGAPTHHEVSPLVDFALPALMSDRGYRPIEFTSIMYRPISHALETAPQSNVTARRADSSDAKTWVDVSVEGWSEYAEYADVIRECEVINAGRDDLELFLAEKDGRPIAAGALAIDDDVAYLAGASTIPAARRQGAQLALLGARLQSAVAAGCTIAMMCAQPGSASQRNAERHGFRIAYTRIKWMKPLPE